MLDSGGAFDPAFVVAFVVASDPAFVVAFVVASDPAFGVVPMLTFVLVLSAAAGSVHLCC